MASQFGSACTRHRLVRHTNKSLQLKYPTPHPPPLETKCKFIRLAQSGRKNAQLKNIKLNLNGSVSNAKKSRPSSRHKDKELQLKCPHVWYPSSSSHAPPHRSTQSPPAVVVWLAGVKWLPTLTSTVVAYSCARCCSPFRGLDDRCELPLPSLTLFPKPLPSSNLSFIGELSHRIACLTNQRRRRVLRQNQRVYEL